MATNMSPLQMPAIEPPPGQTSNLVNPTNSLHTTIIASLVVCLVPPTILIPLRLYVRMRILQTFQLVDVLSLLAFAFFVALVALSLTLLNFGEGYHGWDITLETFSGYLRQANYVEIVYMPAILFTKLTVLLQLIQVFVVGKRNLRYYLLHTLIWLNVAFFTILMFLEIFQCWPRVKIWDATAVGHCINISVTFVATAAINVASDLSILALPIFWVSKLRMRLKKKLGLVLVFGTGVFACVSSIMRVAVSVSDIDSLDITYTLAPVNLWGVAEISSGLILACLPFLPRLLSSPAGPRSTKYSSGHQSTVLPHPQTHSSRKDYFEMDEVALTAAPATPNFPERALVPDLRPEDMESQMSLPASNGGAAAMHNANRYAAPREQQSRLGVGGNIGDGAMAVPEIRKTVEIRQHSNSKA